MNNIDPKELTKERNLFDIYSSSRKLPGSLHNQIFTLTIFIILLFYAVYSPKPVHDLAQEVRTWSEIGFDFTTTILGFLIAGFTIFATVSKPNFFINMAMVPYKSSGLSYLKYNFFTLINVFTIYVGFAILCLLINLLASPSGALSLGLSFIFSNPIYLNTAKRLLVGVGLVGVGTWFFYLLVILQSFIFNIYYIVMTSIRWEIEFGEEKQKGLNKSNTSNNN